MRMNTCFERHARFHKLRARGKAGTVLAVSALLMVALATLLGATQASAQAMYRMKPLGRMGGCAATVPVAMDFNNANRATGQACNANGDQHAFVWRNTGADDIVASEAVDGVVAEEAADHVETQW